MKDEEYVYISDVRDKKITARSARNQRMHNGRRGRVKLPSDFLTKKELKAMNGKVESYKLNDPMTWKEFKKMPDDLKTTYIKLFRKRYNVPDSQIAEMLGVHKVTLCNFFKTMGLARGGKRSGTEVWDKEGWTKWRMGIPVTKDDVAEEEIIEPEAVCEGQESVQENEETTEWWEPIPEEAIIRKAIPCSGNMTFNGTAEAALRTALDLLGDTKVHLSITWEMLDE